MKIIDRLYWFGRNLLALIWGVPFIPVIMTVKFFRVLHILCVTDGSETISFPWEWDWRL